MPYQIALFLRSMAIISLFGALVTFNEFLHLKTGISYIANNTVLIHQQLANCQAFKQYEKILVNEAESYAANSIMINNQMLMPAGYPHTINAVIQAGYRVITVDTSEFRKIDGGLSCLSLRF